MERGFNHRCEHAGCCEHLHITFCPDCKRPYCEDCGKEWIDGEEEWGAVEEEPPCTQPSPYPYMPYVPYCPSIPQVPYVKITYSTTTDRGCADGYSAVEEEFSDCMH